MDQNMDYAVRDIEVSEHLVQAETDARAPKTGFYAVSYAKYDFLPNYC